MNNQRRQALGFLGYVALFVVGFIFHEQILGLVG